MTAPGWLAPSGRLDLVRIRCDLAAAAPQGGLEPTLPNAVPRHLERGVDLAEMNGPDR